MKKLNRKKFLEFLLNKTSLTNTKQTGFTGNNIYFLTDEDNSVEHYQIEFIPQSKQYHYTILIRGIIKEAEFLHGLCVEYLRGLDLGRNIIVDTELSVTHI